MYWTARGGGERVAVAEALGNSVCAREHQVRQLPAARVVPSGRGDQDAHGCHLFAGVDTHVGLDAADVFVRLAAVLRQTPIPDFGDLALEARRGRGAARGRLPLRTEARMESGVVGGGQSPCGRESTAHLYVRDAMNTACRIPGAAGIRSVQRSPEVGSSLIRASTAISRTDCEIGAAVRSSYRPPPDRGYTGEHHVAGRDTGERAPQFRRAMASVAPLVTASMNANGGEDRSRGYGTDPICPGLQPASAADRQLGCVSAQCRQGRELGTVFRRPGRSSSTLDRTPA